MLKKLLIAAAGLSLLVGLFIAYFLYVDCVKPTVNLKDNPYSLKIKRNMNLQDVTDLLLKDSIIQNKSGFERMSKLLKYKDATIKTGHYLIEPHISSFNLVKILARGRQTPVKFTFNNLRTIQEFINYVSLNLDISEPELEALLYNENFLDSNKVNHYSILSLFIPETHEVYFNISVESLIKKLLKFHLEFWESNQRLDKANELGLTSAEVYTLASIVEKETNHNDERAIVAGVYLNRLSQGMKLQADPTVVFASGDFDLRRILYEHLQIDSPYNTYLYEGLPPGPIYMPSVKSIDAVLNHVKHDFIYFCAAPGYNSRHAFASNFEQHKKNAQLYRKWLNSEGIK